MKLSYFLFAFVLHLFVFMGCESETTNQGSGSTPGTDPISLSVVASTKFTVAVSWTKYTSPLLSYYYVILKDEASGVEIERVKVVSDASTVNFTVGDTGFDQLEEGTNYIVEINAMDASDNIIFPTEGYTGKLHKKNIVTDTREDKKLPTKPSISFTSTKRTETTVNWTESTVSGGASILYDLTVSPSITGSPFTNISGLSKKITGLTPDTQYTFTVKAIVQPTNIGATNEDEAQTTTFPSLSGGTLSTSLDTSFLGFGKVNLSWSPQNKQGTIKNVRVMFNGGGEINATNVTENSANIDLGVCNNPIGTGFQSHSIKVKMSDDMEGVAETTVATFSMNGSGGQTCTPP